MSGSSLSFYPAEERDIVGQYEIKNREPGQLEILFRTCRIASSEGLSELRLATDSARSVARETYQELLAEENVLGRVGVVGGLASLGLLAGRGAGRLVWAVAGAGAGVGICQPHLVQSLYHGQLPEPPSLPSVNFSELGLKSGEYFQSIISSVKQVGQENQHSLGDDKLKITRESSLVFVRSSELKPDSLAFKGDEGMGREEDKDLYATRG